MEARSLPDSVMSAQLYRFTVNAAWVDGAVAYSHTQTVFELATFNPAKPARLEARGVVNLAVAGAGDMPPHCPAGYMHGDPGNRSE